MSEQQEQAPPKLPGVLKLKLGACLTVSTRRALANLLWAAQECNKVRNVAARAWQRWHEDHPEDADVLSPPKLEKEEWMSSKEEIGLSTYLYHHGGRVAPQLAKSLVNACAREVVARLKSRVPYDHTGSARYRWEAILRNEINLDTSRRLVIPVLRMDTALCYAGATYVPKSKDGKPKIQGGEHTEDTLRACGDDSCVLCLPVFRPDGARRHAGCLLFRLEARQLTPGNRLVLRRIIKGDWKYCDSKLKLEEDGTVSFALTYERPAYMTGLDPNRTATLSLEPGESRDPFRISCQVEEDREATWSVGRGGLIKATFHRLNNRRQNMRTRYRLGGNGRKGHGHGRNQRDIRPITHRVHDLLEDIVKKTANEIIKFCLRFDCGTLAYERPRGATWFDHHHLQWDWTRFESQLFNACRLQQIIVPDESTSGVSKRTRRPRQRPKG